MSFAMFGIDPCVGASTWELLLIWGVAIAIPVLAWPALRKLSTRNRKGLVVAALLVLSLFGAAPAEATVPGSGCKQLNEWQWPCWMIEAVWCECTWDDEAGGGGSGAGGTYPW